jgi:hypothetical protein
LEEELQIVSDKLTELSSQIETLEAENQCLEEQCSVLKEENKSAMDTISTLSASLQQLEGLEQASILLDSLEPFGGLKKIDDKTNHLLAIESLLLSFLSVIMFRTHPITRLHAVCHVLYEKCIFGIAATKAVPDKLYKKYVAGKHHEVFSPWKILRAIDLSIGGYLNCNGVEAL